MSGREKDIENIRGLCTTLIKAVYEDDAVVADVLGPAIAKSVIMDPNLAIHCPEAIKAILIYDVPRTRKMTPEQLEERALAEIQGVENPHYLVSEALSAIVAVLGERGFLAELRNWLLKESDAELAGHPALILAKAGQADLLKDALLGCKDPKAQKAIVEMVAAGYMHPSDVVKVLAEGLDKIKDPSVRELIKERLNKQPDDGKRPRTIVDRLENNAAKKPILRGSGN